MNNIKCIAVFLLAIIVTIDISECLRLQRDTDSEIHSSTTKSSETTAKTPEVKVVEQMLHESVNLTQAEAEGHSGHSHPVNSTGEPESISRLFELLNSTLLNVNTLILDAMRNASEDKHEDFTRLRSLVRSVQSMISSQGSDFSHNDTHQLVTSLQNIQRLFTENEKHFQEHLTSRNNNGNLTDSSASRQGRTFALENFMRISNRVSQGLTESVKGAEDTLAGSLEQVQNSIQTQIQNFVQGINNFFSSAASVFQIPGNLFQAPNINVNKTIPGFQQ